MVAFGTSGLRGLATDLTDEFCASATTSFLTGLAPGQPLALSQDLRASSPRIAAAVARAAIALGRDVYDFGTVPTPALALSAGTLKAAGIMVTGSHIPADRNGLKFYLGADEISKEQEATILAGLARAPHVAKTSMSEIYKTTSAYPSRYTKFFGPLALSGLTIGVYQHSSVARDLMMDIIARLGGTPLALGRSDSFVSVDTETLEPPVRAQLSEWGATGQFDAIISTDGDADRPLVTDSTGSQVPGDSLGPLIAKALGATHVVAPVSANTLLDLMGHFTVARTKIGSPHVIEAMRPLIAAGQRVLGYEPNGGVLLGFAAERQGRHLSPLLTRDAMLPLVTILSEMVTRQSSLADLAAALPCRIRLADRIKGIDADASADLMAALSRGDVSALGLPLPPPAAIDTLDGARMHYSGGEVVHIRPSGNAPELRCYVETGSKAQSQHVMDLALAGLRRSLGL